MSDESDTALSALQEYLDRFGGWRGQTPILRRAGATRSTITVGRVRIEVTSEGLGADDIVDLLMALFEETPPGLDFIEDLEHRVGEADDALKERDDAQARVAELEAGLEMLEAAKDALEAVAAAEQQTRTAERRADALENEVFMLRRQVVALTDGSPERRALIAEVETARAWVAAYRAPARPRKADLDVLLRTCRKLAELLTGLLGPRQGAAPFRLEEYEGQVWIVRGDRRVACLVSPGDALEVGKWA